MRALLSLFCTALAALSLTAPMAGAATFSFTGTLTTPVREVQIFSVILDAPGLLTATSYSFAGGTNAAGEVIPNGGFHPYLHLYDAGGQWIASNRNGRPVAEPGTGLAWDALLSRSLDAGSYLVAFSREGVFVPVGGTAPDGFIQARAIIETRGLHWAIDIDGVDSAIYDGPVLAQGLPQPVPLPGAVLPTLTGLAALAGLGLARCRCKV
ncbi:MAG: DVUA0089 family protein [Pseudomonadota bacterium]